MNYRNITSIRSVLFLRFGDIIVILIAHINVTNPKLHCHNYWGFPGGSTLYLPETQVVSGDAIGGTDSVGGHGAGLWIPHEGNEQEFVQALSLAFPRVSSDQCKGILAGGALPDSELRAVLYCGVRVTAALWL